ncbi:TldD/PmbA family protein [Hyalangium sp.]|uniref:TldD/PmbA family protein n=1 Tax=Hyalangium sp. TaxID=2028555 RepID=UPI002D2377CB|nr:metallopeptidase TldD-related protein [Hyalangium sp.]HYH96822.1 metallopeptidase TldD-related protein [Hyalangium sp.]
MPPATARTKRPTPAQLAPLATRQVVAAPLLPQPLIERLLAVAMERGGELAEVYIERALLTAVILEESRIKSAQTGLIQGVGIRVISGAKVGYAYSDDLDEAALLRAARTAAMIAQGGGSEQSFKVSRTPSPSYYKVSLPLADVDVALKAELVLRADKAARRFDSRVKQVNGSYVDNTKRIAVANTLGHYTEDTQDLCRIGIQVVAEGKNKERRTGFYGGGGRVSFSHFDAFTPEQVGREAARQAVATLGAAECQAGPQTVVLAPGWSGILLHEAVGHGLEADFIRKGTSLFAGKVGEKVASDLVTVIDDGTVANSRGSINVDDEGVPGERKVLIEKGVLKGYMYDSLNAKLMGQRSTGSGRRESFKSMPLPRMTNTYLAPGDHSPEDILKEVKRGLYCAHFGGGQVDITNGNFVFEVSEAYQIEDGKIGRPVKNAILIGVGPEALKNVSRVGCDPMPDPGMGTCGKDGQSVPVGVGLPTLRIDNMTVGGTKVS